MGDKPQYQLPYQMSNTKYDIPQTKGQRLIGITKDPDSYSVNSKKTNMSQYKKYNIKDYNMLQANLQSQKLGGLGANIGSEEWEVAKRKKEIQMQYA